MERENLIKDIRKFISESTPLYNQSKVVNKEECKELIYRIENIRPICFRDKKDYDNFLNRIESPQKKKEKIVLRHMLNEDNLDGRSFNFMLNYLIWVVQWLSLGFISKQSC